MEKENILDLIPSAKKLSSLELDNLSEYYTSIKLLSEQGLNLEFNNKDQYHGTIVMSFIFQNAKTEIKIFAGTFNGEICDSPLYLNSLEKAISNSEKKLTVIFEKDPNKNAQAYSLLKSLIDKYPDRVKVFQLKEEFTKNLISNSKLGHFTLGDDCMYRYEIDTVNYKAFCNFDDRNTVAQLDSNFAVLNYNSTPLALN